MPKKAKKQKSDRLASAPSKPAKAAPEPQASPARGPFKRGRISMLGEKKAKSPKATPSPKTPTPVAASPPNEPLTPTPIAAAPLLPPPEPISEVLSSLFREAEEKLQTRVLELFQEKLVSVIRDTFVPEVVALRGVFDQLKNDLAERVERLESNLGGQLQSLTTLCEENKKGPSDEGIKEELDALITKFPAFASTSKLLNRIKKIKKRGRPSNKLKNKGREETLKPTKAAAPKKPLVPEIEKKKRGRKPKLVDPVSQSQPDFLAPIEEEEPTQPIMRRQSLPHVESENEIVSANSLEEEKPLVIAPEKIAPAPVAPKIHVLSPTTPPAPALTPLPPQVCSVEELVHPVSPAKQPVVEPAVKLPYMTFANLNESLPTSRFPSDTAVDKPSASRIEEPESLAAAKASGTSKTSIADLLPMSTKELGSFGSRLSNNDNSQSSRNQPPLNDQVRRRSFNESKYQNDSKAFSFD